MIGLPFLRRVLSAAAALLPPLAAAQAFPSKPVRLVAPKGTPKATVDKLNAALKSVLAMPKAREGIEATGAIVVGNSADEYQKQVSDELTTYRRVVLEQQLKLE